MFCRIFTFAAIGLWAGALAAAEPAALFQDSFDGKLGEGWSWLREHEGAWRIKEGGLEIRVEPGVAHNVKNSLVRSAPDRNAGRFAAEVTITSTSPPTNQYEQAGITWYVGGEPLVKLVKEYIDGETWIVLAGPLDPEGKRGLAGKIPLKGQSVTMRLTVSRDRYRGEFRAEGKEAFESAGSGPLPAPKDDQVSLQCYNGPADAEHWFRFDEFKIVKMAE